MRIDVSDILAQSEGFRTSFKIADEAIELDDLLVAGNTNGRVTLTRSEQGLELDGNLDLTLTLECHRCLRPYAFPEELKLRGEFNRLPSLKDEDSWPIAKDFSIDLLPLIHQEAILNLPIKQLCSPDCAGLDIETGQPLKN